MNSKRLWSVVLGLIVFLGVNSSLYAADDSKTIASYGVGYNTGKEVGKSANFIEKAKFAEGIKDFFAKKEPAYSQDELTKAGEEVNKLVAEETKKNPDAGPDIINSLELPAGIKDVISYGSGYMYAVQISQGGDIFAIDSLIAGLEDGVGGKKSAYSDDQIKGAMKELEDNFTKKMNEELTSAAKPNIEAGKKFMEEYVKQDGVTVTPEGMAYKVIKVGTGATPSPTSDVKVHYAGRLVDGTEFDSSIKRGEPAVFNLQNVIKGWQLIVPQMKVGDKWEVVIPYELGYGLQGASGAIKPGDTLIFEMELLGIEK